MAKLKLRNWVPERCEIYTQHFADDISCRQPSEVGQRLDSLLGENRKIHEVDCFNLNPATNVMKPKAEAALSAGLAYTMLDSLKHGLA